MCWDKITSLSLYPRRLNFKMVIYYYIVGKVFIWYLMFLSENFLKIYKNLKPKVDITFSNPKERLILI